MLNGESKHLAEAYRYCCDVFPESSNGYANVALLPGRADVGWLVNAPAWFKLDSNRISSTRLDKDSHEHGIITSGQPCEV